MLERFVEVNSVRLHLNEFGTDSKHLPLVCLAGGLGTAEVFSGTLSALEPRRSLALTKRGNGKSDKPESGYDLDTQVQDLLCAIEQICAEPVILLAYSAAVPVGILAASQASDRIGGLILCDYPAIFPDIPESYIEAVTSDAEYDPEDCPQQVLEAIVRESARRELEDVLPAIECPVLILHGLGHGSYLKPEHLSTYGERVCDVRFAGIKDAGHGFILTHSDVFLKELTRFLAETDS